jgi:hypothetical protein
MLGHWTGVFTMAHHISESGQGKSILDGIFGLLTQFLNRVTRTGKEYDILKAADLRKALSAYDGLKGNSFYEIVYDRHGEQKLKKGAFAGLKKMKSRQYKYDKSGNFISLSVHEHSFCNNKGTTYTAQQLKSKMVGGNFQGKPNTVVMVTPPGSKNKYLEWEADYTNKKKQKKQARINKLAEKKREELAEKKEMHQKNLAMSKAFPCPTDGCYRVFAHKARLNAHLQQKKCGPTKKIFRACRSKKGIITSGATIKDVVINAMKDRVTQVNTSGNLTSYDAPDEALLQAGKLLKKPVYFLVGGEKWKVKNNDLYAAGYARSFRVRGSTRFTPKQLEFLKWAFSIGEKNKSEKLTSHLAASIMKIVGTMEGQNRFPREPYLKASADGSAKFKRKELIMHYEIKSFFGRTKGDKEHDC